MIARRLDDAIEDSSIFNNGNETFVIGNPGRVAERTFDSFYNFLYPGTAQNNTCACRHASILRIACRKQ